MFKLLLWAYDKSPSTAKTAALGGEQDIEDNFNFSCSVKEQLMVAAAWNLIQVHISLNLNKLNCRDAPKSSANL